MPTTKEIVEQYTFLGQLIAHEISLGEQLITLTLDQRQAHQKVLEQQDIVNNIKHDINRN